MIRKAVWEDIPQLKKIWKEAFGDGDDYLDLYFSGYFHPEKVWVWQEDVPVSMVTVYDNKGFMDRDGSLESCPCIFAVATLKAFWGRHIAVDLIHAIRKELEENGQNLLMISPADEGLRKLYGREHGFQDFFAMKHLVMDEKNRQDYKILDTEKHMTVKPVSFELYNRIREQWLYGHPHLIFTEEQMRLQWETCRLFEGGFYGVYKEEVLEAVFIAERLESCVFIKELLVGTMDAGDILRTLAAAYENETLDIRMVPWEETVAEAKLVPTAMLYGKDGQKPGLSEKEEVPYAGLVFD